MNIKDIKAMLKLIPNNFPVCLEDLYEIYGIQYYRTMEEFRSMAKEIH